MTRPRLLSIEVPPQLDYRSLITSLLSSRLPARERAEDHDDFTSPQPRDAAPPNRLPGLQHTVVNQAMPRMLGTAIFSKRFYCLSVAHGDNLQSP